jgi:hypothetical protein
MPKAGAHTRRTAVVALALAALATAGGAEVLASAQVHPRMTIKVKRQVGKDTFKGRIKAKDPVCIRNRKVKLVIRKPSREKRRAGSAKTNRKGKWKFVPKPNREQDQYAAEGARYADPGDWRAKVREKHVRGVTCAAGKTSPIHVG